MAETLPPDQPVEPLPDQPDGPLPDQPDEPPPSKPTPRQTLGAMWLYTLLRYGLFVVLWAVLWLARVPGLLAALIALVLSVPLSYVLLRRQRAKMAANLEQRIVARRAQERQFDARLSGEDRPPTD
jgi:Protein of unknown function (DUF4229)